MSELARALGPQEAWTAEATLGVVEKNVIWFEYKGRSYPVFRVNSEYLSFSCGISP